MEADEIKEVRIDSSNRLFVLPKSKTFPYIYREAMEVSWDCKSRALHSPVPRKWSHVMWFQQILDAAREQGCELVLTVNTHWLNVPISVKDEILALPARPNA